MSSRPGRDSSDELDLGTGDRVIHRKFGRAIVMRAAGNRYFFASSEPYVVAANLARALQWGSRLFGRLGFAVLQPDRGPPDDPFFVVGMEEPLSIKELDGLNEDHLTIRPTHFVNPQDFLPVTVVTREGISLSELSAHR